MPGRIDGQQHAPDRRRARLAERVGGLAQAAGQLRERLARRRRTTSGSASIDITMPGDQERLRRDEPRRWRAGRGSRGSPARRSAGRRSRARCWGRPRSSRSPTRPPARAPPGARTPTARRPAPRRAARRSRMPIAVTMKVPDRSGPGSRRLALVQRRRGRFARTGSGSGRRCPSTSMNSTIPAAIRHRPIPVAQQSPVGDAVDQRPERSAVARRRTTTGGVAARGRAATVAIRRRSRSA